MKQIKNLLPVLFVLALSLFSIIPLFHAGFFPIHDNTQVQRVFEMTRSLQGGMFPVRWAEGLGFGFGYPIFNFYAPLAYYVGSFINIVGLDVLSATKIMMGFGIMLSGISMYFFSRELWGKSGGVIAALLYVFIPYHAVDIYVRGDVAEFWAYAFIPLIFYFILKIHQTGKFRFIVGGGLAFAALIISHNLTAFMATPFILIFAMLLYLGNKKTGKGLPIALILGLLLSAFYWLPALLEINYTNVLSQIGGGADYKDHFICLSQLWSSPWGFGGSVKGCVDGLSFMVGKMHILLSLFSIILFGLGLYFKKVEKKKGILLIYFSLALLFSVFLTLGSSKFIWDALRPMAIFQYPWRFLIMVAFFISIISGSIVYSFQSFIKNKWINLILIVVLSVVIVLFNGKYFMVQKYLTVTASSFTNDYFLKFRTSQISSEYMPKNFLKPKAYTQLPKGAEIVQGKIIIVSQKQTANKYEFNYGAKTEAKIIVPLAYFPAWKVSIDGKDYSYVVKDNGLLVALPKGSHLLVFNFIETNVERLADLLSVAGIFALILGIILKKKSL